jgi:hypothetical protein
MKNLPEKENFSPQSGIAAIMVLLFIFIFLGLLVGIDYGYVYYLNHCGDTPINTCFTDSPKKPKEQSPKPNGEKTPITAIGNFSYKNYTVTISMTFPLEGGAVSGDVKGDCSGTVRGAYKGGDNGIISGNIFGSCTVFLVPIPAKASFSGKVNQQQKTIPIEGNGGAAGFSGSGSIILTY